MQDVFQKTTKKLIGSLHYCIQILHTWYKSADVWIFPGKNKQTWSHTSDTFVFKKNAFVDIFYRKTRTFAIFCGLVLNFARLVIEVSHDKKFAQKLDQNINHLMQINICYRFWSKFCAKLWPKYPSCVDLHQKFNMTSNIIANFVTHSLEKRLFCLYRM